MRIQKNTDIEKPRKGDIWVSSSRDGSQIVYFILKVFFNNKQDVDFRGLYPKNIPMVKYKIRESSGDVKTRSYPVKLFLNKPFCAKPFGIRKLAIRPL